MSVHRSPLQGTARGVQSPASAGGGGFAFPQTVKFGERSPRPMWDLYRSALGPGSPPVTH